MTAFYAPDPINSTQLIPGGNTPAAGALLFCYQVGSSTKQNTYTDATASTARTNPIVLDSGGNIPGNGEVWIASTAKFVLAPFNDTDPPVSPYWSRDNLPGVNDPSQVQSEWIPSGLTPTFISGSSFIFSGDQTGTFTPGRRLRTLNTGGTRYSTIGTSAFSASTTIGIQSDTIGIDSGLSAVSYGLLNPKNTSLPLIVSVLNFGAKGDGVTDDTAAIQAAINSSALAVYLPAATYKITSTLSLKQNLLFYGDGENASILNYTGAGVAVQAVGSVFPEVWKSTVRGIKITTSTGTHGLRLKDLSDFSIEHTFITGFSTAGLHLTGTASTGGCICVRIFKNWFQANTGDGILTDSVNTIHQITIHGNRIQGNTGIGLNISAAGFGWSVLGNDIEGNSGVCEVEINGGSVSGLDFGGNYLESSSAKSGGTIRIANTLAQNGISIHGNFFIADVAITNAITCGVSNFVTGISIQGNNFSGSYTNAINPAAVISGIFGPNRCASPIVHVAALGASTTGVEIIEPTNTKVPGTASNDSALAGYYGEYVSAAVASTGAIALTTATTATITSTILTAGDWDVTGVVDFMFAAGTNYTNLKYGMGTSAAFTGQDTFGDYETAGTIPTNARDMAWSIPTSRISASTTITAFLLAEAVFTASTTKAYGTIRARRMR